MKKKGFKQKFFTVGKLVATDRQGASLDTFPPSENTSHYSDKYNLHGKNCSIFPSGDTIIIHRNFNQIDGLPEIKIPELIAEIKFIVNELKTTASFSDKGLDCDFLAFFTVKDKIHLAGSKNLFEDFEFEKMDVKRESDSEIILNPDIVEEMNHNEISKAMKDNPDLFSRKLGWNQIKIKNTATFSQINFEYKDNNLEKILEMIHYPQSYLHQIINKANLKDS